MALKPLLIAKAPQVNEWALRAVADLGPQSILLKDAILELRPGAMRVFSGQQKTIHQLIGHIQDSWPKV